MCSQFFWSIIPDRNYLLLCFFPPGDANRWERYLFLFAEMRHLETLSVHVPTENPTLKASAYNMVLRACIPYTPSHERLLKLIKTWPPGVYAVGNLAKEVQQGIQKIRGDKSVLMEVLARLYIFQVDAGTRCIEQGYKTPSTYCNKGLLGFLHHFCFISEWRKFYFPLLSPWNMIHFQQLVCSPAQMLAFANKNVFIVSLRVKPVQ